MGCFDWTGQVRVGQVGGGLVSHSQVCLASVLELYHGLDWDGVCGVSWVVSWLMFS